MSSFCSLLLSCGAYSQQEQSYFKQLLGSFLGRWRSVYFLGKIGKYFYYNNSKTAGSSSATYTRINLLPFTCENDSLDPQATRQCLPSQAPLVASRCWKTEGFVQIGPCVWEKAVQD